jgi:Tfp pilus assembly protein PilN
MIKINLLPSSLRVKESERKIPLPSIIYITTLFVVIFHIVFGILGIYKKAQVISLDHSWEKMQSRYKEVDVLKKNLSLKKDEARVMEAMLKRGMYFTDFFNKINQSVPKGLWLNRLSFSQKGLVIEGSIFSFGTDEVSLVNKFFNELKNDSFFVNNFNNFKLDSVQRRNIKDYEVLDFLLTGGVNKEKSELETSKEKTGIKKGKPAK